jgi:NAD(P)-dependent dehydrogenase (short-subunit alcohol dehydrogenase family)
MHVSCENNVALVTGAGSGRGLATATAFAEAGASVVLAGLGKPMSNGMANAQKRAPPRHCAHVANETTCAGVGLGSSDWMTGVKKQPARRPLCALTKQCCRQLL